MKLHLFPVSRALFVILIFTCHAPTSFGANNEQYTTCSQSFQCSNIPNIRYPFWGGTRPRYCGHPSSSFELNCQLDAPQITIQSREFRVLAIDNVTRTLTVVRAEFWNNTCPRYLYNNPTLDSSSFSYASNSQNLTIYYGCPGIITIFSNQFACNNNGSDTASYYLPNGTSIPSNFNRDFSACNSNITVRVNQMAALTLATTSHLITIKEALDSGFGLQWDANDANCRSCVESGGACGSNSSLEFTCYCSDQPYPVSCDSSTPNGSGMCPSNLVTCLAAGR